MAVHRWEDLKRSRLNEEQLAEVERDVRAELERMEREGSGAQQDGQGAQEPSESARSEREPRRSE